jgi:thiamine transporter
LNEKKLSPVRKLVESALMIAVATVLSLIKFDLPYGGGVTVVSMLPIIICCYRLGWGWGLGSAFVYSLIQLILGLDNVAYAQNFAQTLGIIFLDYILAYTVLGLSYIFKPIFQNRKKATAIGIAFARRIPMTREQNIRTAMAIGIFFSFGLRFLCHWVTGAWIWGEWMPEEFMNRPMTDPWVYSALYNGWYMLAELILTELIAMLLYGPLGKFFRGDDMHKPAEPAPDTTPEVPASVHETLGDE